MIPVTLNISGFLSYWEPVEVDFSSFKLACISGSNGAGKSSLLDATRRTNQFMPSVTRGSSVAGGLVFAASGMTGSDRGTGF